MKPSTQFIASPHRLALLRLNAALLWLAGFLLADAARAVVLGARGVWDWLGLASALLLTAGFGYQLHKRLGWIDQALPSPVEVESSSDSAV